MAAAQTCSLRYSSLSTTQRRSGNCFLLHIFAGLVTDNARYMFDKNLRLLVMVQSKHN